MVVGGAAADVNQQGQTAVSKVVRDARIELITEGAFPPNEAYDGLVSLIAKVPFPIGAGAHGIVDDITDAEGLRQAIDENRLTGMGRSADEDRWK